MEGLSSWSLLGAFLAALVGFGAYMYGSLDARGADQAGVGEYVIPALEVAHLTQPSEGPSQSTQNSSSSTEAAEHTLSAEDTPPIFNDSSSTEQRTGSAVPTEAPSSGDPLMFSEASVPPLPVQAAGITTPADSCTSQVWCANPAPQIPIQAAPQIPIQSNVPTENASSCTGDDGKDSCSKKKPSKEEAEQDDDRTGD
jgi:hypothetical protein